MLEKIGRIAYRICRILGSLTLVYGAWESVVAAYDNKMLLFAMYVAGTLAFWIVGWLLRAVLFGLSHLFASQQKQGQ